MTTPQPTGQAWESSAFSPGPLSTQVLDNPSPLNPGERNSSPPRSAERRRGRRERRGPAGAPKSLGSSGETPGAEARNSPAARRLPARAPRPRQQRDQTRATRSPSGHLPRPAPGDQGRTGGGGRSPTAVSCNNPAERSGRVALPGSVDAVPLDRARPVATSPGGDRLRALPVRAARGGEAVLRPRERGWGHAGTGTPQGCRVEDETP